MTDKEIQALYPEFDNWVHKTRGFMCTGDSLSTIKLWEEWLRVKKKGKRKSTKQGGER